VPTLSFVRHPGVAVPLLVAAPVPISLALIFTARPSYPEDACFYGAPQASIDATDHYLGLMTPLALGAMAVVALAALPDRGAWRLLAPAAVLWALVAMVWGDAGWPVVILGGNIAVFGTFLFLVVLVLVGVVAKEAGWIRAIGWFEFLFLLPVLLGIAGLLAQPSCYAGDPPAPISR
jgi:hypothetical protein